MVLSVPNEIKKILFYNLESCDGMNFRRRFRQSAVAFALVLPFAVSAELPMNYEGEFSVGAGSGDFAPFYISSLRHGRFTQDDNVQAEARLWHDMDYDRRFSFGFGFDVIGGYSSAVSYERYDRESNSWFYHSERPSMLRIQQLYGEIKYRGVFVEAGMKEHDSPIMPQSLTSGDLVESGNARPIPQIRVGFWDFQDIPFTKGWMQISGEVAFGKMMDSSWWRDHYNYYTYHISENELYNYKRCYFRTKPTERLSVTFGMQAVAVFGGTNRYYRRGELILEDKYPAGIKEFFMMLLPSKDGGEGFVSGNHLGTWDIKARYAFANGSELSAYCSWLWEDGSGIGKLNGWDGLWGLGYKAKSKGLVSGAVVEYLDFTNQSGPIHFAPVDNPGTTVPDHVSGADDYYNNASHNSYAYYGQSLGTPAIMAPIYNRDGYPGFIANSLRGFHIGVEGELGGDISYRLKGGYRKAWGTSKAMLKTPIHETAVMLEANWHPATLVKGLSLNMQVELDRGTMPGNAFGALVGIKYKISRQK